MVKVESMTDEEKKEDREFSKLFSIVEEICGLENIVMAVPNLVISIKYPYLKEMLGYYDGEQTDLDDNRRGLDDFIFINYINRDYQIQINSPDCFDAAMKLAEGYENETGKNITIKKAYEEDYF